MSHEDVAAVWVALSRRHDVDNILRELIGAHTLNVSSARRDNRKLRSAFLSHVVTLKVIFDLQRAYLQSSVRGEESRLSALSHEILCPAVLHLLEVVVLSITSCPDLPNEAPYNRLTAHATLSGLRALLLRQGSLAVVEYNLLNSRFEEIYERGHWYGASYTLILRLCRQIIQTLANPSPDEMYYKPACGATALPDFTNPLNFIETDQKSLLDACRSIGAASIKTPTWYRDSLTLYDIFWSTTAALIQLCMLRESMPSPDMRSSAGHSNAESNALQLVLSIKFQLQKHAYISSEMAEARTTEQLQLLLLQDILSTCGIERCQCFKANSEIIQNVCSQYGSQSLSQTLDNAPSNSSLGRDVSEALSGLRSFLDKRSSLLEKSQQNLLLQQPKNYDAVQASDVQPQSQIFSRAATFSQGRISRKELSTKSLPVLPNITLPILASTTSPISTTSQELSITSNDALPVVETDPGILQRHLSDPSSFTTTSNQAASEVLSHKSTHLSSVDEDPPPPFRQVDPDNFPEVHYPRLDKLPLHSKSSFIATTECFPEVYIPDAMPRTPNVEHLQSWQPDRENHPEVAHSLSQTLTAPSVMTQESDGSGSLFRTETSYAKPKKWNTFFGSSRAQSTFSVPSSAFFASGSSLLIWNEMGAGCYDFNNTESIQFRRINASGVCMAAGGKKRCAVAIKGISDYRIEVYEGPCDVPLSKWKLESLPYSITMSRNDKLVAAKFSRTVKIFQIEDGATFRHELPPSKSRSGRGNHLVTFSVDSLSFVASTRYEPEKVVTYWSECTNSSNARVMESSAPTGFPGDNGLSSLLCSSTKTRGVFLSTFTEKSSPVFHSMGSSKSSSRLIHDSKGSIGTRIHHSALCPNGTNIVLVNQRNNVFWVDDCWSPISEPRRVGTLKKSIGVTREIEMGMPNSDEVNLFWIEKGKGMLVTMGRGGGKTKPIELVVNLQTLVS